MYNLIEKYITSFNSRSYIHPKFVIRQRELQGLAGAGTAQVISKCVSYMDPKNVYLEVGIYQAANLCMVAETNRNKTCIGVDNFCEAFSENSNFPGSTTEEVVQFRIKDLSNCSYKKNDFRYFFQTNEDLKGRVEVYFFDGPHKLQDQIDGVEMALPFLCDDAVIFVDDWESDNVQKASEYLLDCHKELIPLKLFTASINVRDYFNQGQCVMAFKRKK